MSMAQTRRAGFRTAILATFLFGLIALPMSASNVQAASPTLTILSPTEGAVLANGDPALVQFAVSDFVLVQPGRAGQNASLGEGHANVFLDGRWVRLVTEVAPFSLALRSGIHTIEMQLVHSNGTPLNPEVRAAVTVTATQGPAGTVPSIEILSPGQNDRTGHGTYVSYRVRNFTVVEPKGQANAPNEGRVQLLVLDQVAMELVGVEPVLLVGMPEAEISITVRLVNNDGSPLTPDASDTVDIHVVAASAITLPLLFNGGMSLLLAFTFVVLVLRRRQAAARDRKARGGQA
jgi:hypothetical protein